MSNHAIIKLDAYIANNGDLITFLSQLINEIKFNPNLKTVKIDYIDTSGSDYYNGKYIRLKSDDFVTTYPSLAYPEVTFIVDINGYAHFNFNACFPLQTPVIQPGSTMYQSVTNYTPPNITPVKLDDAKCNVHTPALYHGLMEKYTYCKVCGDKLS